MDIPVITPVFEAVADGGVNNPALLPLEMGALLLDNRPPFFFGGRFVPPVNIIFTINLQGGPQKTLINGVKGNP